MSSIPFADATLIFDLDGTLVDTAPDLMGALNFILASQGHGPVALEEVRQMVGQGARALIQKGLTLKTGHAPSEALLDQLFDDFIQYYGKHIADESALFPALDHLLPAYQAAGICLGVCTNKLESLSRQLLEALGLTSYFPALVGRDTVGIAKPDPAPLFEAIKRAGGTPDRTVYVGDSLTDVSTAKAAHIPIVVVSFGYTEIPPADLGGDILIDHFDELNEAAAQLLR